ncbi:mandelate racemase/muconate lactonizing enzyme family protein [Anatilimnocola floriformis]|uniref:mandelate racemase/muconate lactonizing enzyme family protein n=1 Tax=Anatilimnocola floriformis TaxID=2948575 RepID=UPI0020C34805|nr:mandelate racemase/muconate lactonizing enzyme family protein [Anatilimnocola floriformis]
MKIAAVKTIPLGGATHDHGWPGGTDPNVQYNTLVEVISDEGITGLGSCYTTRALVEGALELLRPHLIGEPADQPDRVSEKLRQSMFWLGRGGSVEHAISGIDIALWDLWGQALQQPVSKLLGGNYRDRIKPYASILFDQPEPLRDALLVQKERGFRAIKMGWRPFGRVSRQLDELLIRTARETVGEDVELMVDAGGSEQFWPHSVNWARETAKMLGDYNITWFEEALKPDDVEGFAQLQATSPVLISTGEVLTRRQAFQPFLLKRAVDIIQPDLTKCGGLSEGRKLAWLAYDQGVLLVPHGWNTAVGVAADLALSAAMPVARWVEYQTGVPYIEDILEEPFKLDAEGMLQVPSGPGLGIKLNRDAIARMGAGG